MVDTKKEQERDELHRAIWAIADELRGAVDGWDFKNYVLGTMFYRYISVNLCNYINSGEIDAGNTEFDFAKMPDEDAEEAKEGLVEEKGFFILPSELFCNVRANAANDENLNETLERVFRHIEESAKGSEAESDFAGLFDDYDVNSNKLGSTVAKRNEKLVKLLNGVGEMNLGDVKDHSIDAFGDAYEYLMTMYASNAGKSGGEFFTPADVSELLTRLGTVGKTEINKVYDPACGSGSLLLKAEKILGKDAIRNGFYGQEINITTYNLCRINMFLHDVGFDKFDIACEDTLLSPQHWDDEPFELIVQDKYVGVLKYEQDGITYYFIDNQEFFTGFSPYTSDTKFEIEKYTFFDKAVLSMLPLIDFKPDIIHCHDWQTGLLPVYLKNEFAANPFFWGIKTIITIHNLKFQGIWDREWVQGVSGLTDNLFTPDKLEFKKDANMLKGGLVYADYITTVSDTYANEIQTEYYGEGLNGLLSARHFDMQGIVNGIDYNAYDPQTDGRIYCNYNASDFRKKKFNNKTNGITQRRFLAHGNPLLADWVTDKIGPDWITDLSQLSKLKVYADDEKALQEFMTIKFKNKERLAKYILEHNGVEVDPHSIFDIQVKRLHEYKRQLLNILHVIYLYNQIKAHPEMDFYPRTFIFGAKASAAYARAKKIIKLINCVAADVSEQISTASKEASGTGNMKFMLNGAPTLGTMDGANVEIVQEVGEENAFIFGMSSDQIINYENNGGYDPDFIYNTDPEIRQVLMQLINGTFSSDTEMFRDIYNSLLDKRNMPRPDQYFILGDFRSYAEAQKRVEEAYKDEKRWAKMALLNTACSGKFTSDRTIQEYVDDIWHLDKVIVKEN